MSTELQRSSEAPACPWVLRSVRHLFYRSATPAPLLQRSVAIARSYPEVDQLAGGEGALMGSIDIACAGGRARSYTEADKLAWEQYGLDCLASSDDEEMVVVDGVETLEPSDGEQTLDGSDGPRTPTDGMMEGTTSAASSITVTPSNITSSVASPARILCPATHNLDPPSPPSPLDLVTVDSIWSSPRPENALPWVREQREWDGWHAVFGSRRRVRERENQRYLELETERLLRGREAPPSSPMTSRGGRLLELLPNKFIFRTSEEKSLSSAVILRNTQRIPVVYKIIRRRPRDLPIEERSKYERLIWVSGNCGLLQPGQEVHVRGEMLT
ncbi:hypothetical protein CALCODRAFT_284314 [Calocera cornea HHB12733]|uniref:MSP domain-containing protein n=1 Tax=Calocera cornea HHB12733 TaxID=1353952 RepID=A0A165FZJ3_9BASI|nr:hypothetical protein CALCODRAFT_284314 [Calocera cornea HHB12733]